MSVRITVTSVNKHDHSEESASIDGAGDFQHYIHTLAAAMVASGFAVDTIKELLEFEG